MGCMVRETSFEQIQDGCHGIECRFLEETYITFNLQTYWIFFITIVKANPYPTTFFILKILSAFYIMSSATYIKVHFSLDFSWKQNNMNPDQTAPLEAQSDLCP